MKNGFTLIELIIATVIFSFLIALAAYSFGYYAGFVKRLLVPYPQKAINFSLLNDVLKSTFYFASEKKNIFGENKFFTYFYGTRNTIVFISAKPLGSYNLALCKLYLDNGTVFLKETPIYCKYVNYKNPSFTGKCEKVFPIFKNIKNLSISYYLGRESLDSIKNKIPELLKLTLTNFSDNKTTLYIKIMSNFNKKKNLTWFLYVTH